MHRPTTFGPMLLIALTLNLLAGCTSLTKPWLAPEVTPTGLEPRGLGLGGQSFIVRLLVKNPNDRTLPIKAMTYRLYLEGEELANGSSELDRQIPAFGEQMLDLRVNSNLFAVLPQLPALALTEDKLDWKITGTFTVAGGLVTLPYRYSGEVDPGTLLSAVIR